MADQQAFFDLLDIMESERAVEPKRFFALMRSTFNIENLLYIDVELLPRGFRVHRLCHTFEADLPEVYRDRNAGCIDAVLRMASGDIRPVDLADSRKRYPASETLFQAALHFGLTPEGIILPLSAPARRCARLVIQADVAPAEWASYRRCHLRDFQLLANLFHASLLESDARRRDQHPASVILTNRETEVLGWAAAGKSYWEIATILGITERTVRFFMTNARRKLNVVSNTQAVAQAMRHALIPVS
ncbi:helix-turn-helix transcriptional regulator [Pararhizobium antarcticum]|uniref:Transcriptional regulator n=1 Tax=Pararhizobium antarcticum TaxID=1798805 RepID=A0A657LNN9_9HYPH|nr:LuxR C-terminal-related transcriptional regulator [Pararhizobium antarcticum]OJF93422.1 transcriptional regulator [Pararhizobium antarcticum]OJG00474.1 transcriptional regulator [Rhizobium sp. 58]